MPWISPALILILFVSLGFPGNYTKVFGFGIKPLFEYAAFVLQLLIMAVTSSNDMLEIKLLDMDFRFRPIYWFVFEIFISSMIVTSYRQDQFISCFRVMITAFFSLWMIKNISIKTLLKHLYYAQILFTAVSAAFPVLFPAYDIRSEEYEGVYVGILGVKNAAASELAFGLLMQTLLYMAMKEDDETPGILFYLTFSVQIILLLLTRGTGSLFMLAIPLLFAIHSMRQKKCSLDIGMIYLVVNFGFLFIALNILPLFEPLLNMLGKDATLTGRIPLWRQLISVMQQTHTLFGFGYGMFWRDQQAVDLMHAGFSEYSFMSQMTSGSHNNVMELLANDGIAGIAVFFLSILASTRHLKKAPLFTRIYVTSHLLFHMLHGLTERDWSNFQYGLVFLFISMGMSCMYANEKMKAPEKVREKKKQKNEEKALLEPIV